MSQPTNTERCIESLITIFQRYAGADGDGSKMTVKEFENFLKAELPSFMQNQKDPTVVKKMLSKLDGSAGTTQDGCLDFSEFLNLMGGLACSCHDALCSGQRRSCK